MTPTTGRLGKPAKDLARTIAVLASERAVPGVVAGRPGGRRREQRRRGDQRGVIMVAVFSAFAALSLIDLVSSARLRLGRWPVAVGGCVAWRGNLRAVAHAGERRWPWRSPAGPGWRWGHRSAAVAMRTARWPGRR